MRGPEITAVIPTYRRPKLLRRAVKSVLSQTYPHLKVMVFDNASGDETAGVVAALAQEDSRVHYHCHERNIGPHANFEYGMEAVETPYFTFLSDDDFLLPGFYEHATTCLERHPEAEFFCGQVVVYGQERRTHSLRPTTHWKEGVYAAGEATVRMLEEHFVWTGCLFTSKTRATLGPLDPVTMDVLFLVRAAASFSFVVSLVPCAVYSIHGSQSGPGMSLHDLAGGYRRLGKHIAGMAGVSRGDATRIAKRFEDVIFRTAGPRLKTAFMDGDWPAFDDALAFLRSRGGARRGKKIVEMLASGNRDSLLVRAARAVYRMRRDRRMRRRGSSRPAKAEDLVRIHGGRAVSTCGGPSGRAPS